MNASFYHAKVVIFDVDDTLAESFQPPKPEMVTLLSALLENMPIGIMSGAGFERIHSGFLVPLETSKHLDRLYVLPNSATEAYTWANGWNEEYALALSDDERANIKAVLARAAEEVPLIRDCQHFGERASDRRSQIAFTVVGLDAPQEFKMAWDPGAAKRREILKYLAPKLSGYTIRTGGASTIDITRADVDKAYGVRWIAERLKVAPKDMLYVGDALYEGGNDAVVIPTGVMTRQVTGPAETAEVIDELLTVCATS